MRTQLPDKNDAIWVRQRFTLKGRFSPSMSAYLKERAQRLSLQVTLDLSPKQTIVVAAGPGALLGALEMAACIAPDDCLVVEWKVEDIGSSPGSTP